MANSTISLVLIDDNRLLREGLAGLIREQPDFKILAASADIDPVHVEEVCGAKIRLAIGLREFETHLRRIGVVVAGIVHRKHDPLDLRELGFDRVSQVGGERRDAALTREVRAEKCDAMDTIDHGGVQFRDQRGLPRSMRHTGPV